jgi:hypothetical protein
MRYKHAYKHIYVTSAGSTISNALPIKKLNTTEYIMENQTS